MLPQIGEILEAIIAAFRKRGIDDETEFYAELVEQGISHTAAAKLWRDKMATDLSFFRSESAQRLRDQGRADLDQLDAWLVQALTATCAAELFD